MQCNGPGARVSVNDANFSPNLVLAPDLLFQVYLENSKFCGRIGTLIIVSDNCSSHNINRIVSAMEVKIKMKRYRRIKLEETGKENLKEAL